MTDPEDKKSDSPPETSYANEGDKAVQNGDKEAEHSRIIYESITAIVRHPGSTPKLIKIFERPKTSKRPEAIPTQDEVFSIIKQFTEGMEHRIRRERRDEKGLYLWDIVVRGRDGGEIEYSYMRKGRYKEGQAKVTAIHRTFYDRDGMPEGGDSVAKLINGKWKITP